MKNNPASPATARAINDRTALDLFVRHASLSAPQLRDLTGLSRPSVADLLERLQDSGLVQLVGEAEQRRRGPKAKLYGLVADHAHVVGVEVAEEAVHASVADLTGVVAASANRTINPDTSLPQLIARAIRDAVRRAGLEIADVHTVVIGAPGAVDTTTGALGPGYSFPGWDDNLLPELVDLLDVPVVFENEVNLAGVVELHNGAGRGRHDLAVLWLDRSVGASIILDGRLRQGVSGGAGEVGKLALPGGSLPVAGKASGGFHDLAGSEAVVRLAGEHGIPKAPVHRMLTDLREDDEPATAAFIAELAERVALAALAVVAVVDPGLIVLAGDVGQAGGERLANAVTKRLTVLDATPTDVYPSTLPDGLIVDGAILTGLEIAHDDIFGGGPEPAEA
ncbi:ROK family transcriptional regulator [Stackebrandtia soli]|uniref:ROK family transcriptional regulator n=1 Tax=Stackebrandtia soli TaxID=1892856 RepID=UPI0039EB56B3